MSEGQDGDSSGSLVSNRTMNIVVALLLMIVATVVMVSSYRLGAGWQKFVGPASGYFPFYVALIMFVSSGITLVQYLLSRHPDRGGSFLSRYGLVMVLQVFIPMTIFVILSMFIGIYVSTALFIGFFMTWHGRYPFYKAMPVAILVPVALFVIFEIWFLVPLPKGPLEGWLGY